MDAGYDTGDEDVMMQEVTKMDNTCIRVNGYSLHTDMKNTLTIVDLTSKARVTFCGTQQKTTELRYYNDQEEKAVLGNLRAAITDFMQCP